MKNLNKMKEPKLYLTKTDLAKGLGYPNLAACGAMINGRIANGSIEVIESELTALVNGKKVTVIGSGKLYLVK